MEEVGSSMDNIVKTLILITNREDYPRMRRTELEYYQKYASFLVDVAEAIRSLGDPRIIILNSALSPGGDYGYLAYIDAMATVPGAMDAFDVWASHPYPGNHPPEYNIHDGTATYRDATIDTYLLELERLTAHGRPGMQVLLTGLPTCGIG